MWWWYGPHPMWGMVWIFPLIGLALMVICMFGMARFFRTRAGFCGGRRYNEIEDLRKEIRELKDEITKLGKKE